MCLVKFFLLASLGVLVFRAVRADVWGEGGINFKIFAKIWSNLLSVADVYTIQRWFLFKHLSLLFFFIFRDETMSSQPRVAKVLATLLVSMTAGAIILMALGNNPPSAGPFCLYSYYHLNPVEKAVSSRTTQYPTRWNCIEVYYSGTKAGNIAQLASLSGLTSSEDLNCHFVICNGLGGSDGQIQATEKWQRQWSSIPGRSWYGTGQTIRICIVADDKTASVTDLQITRAEALAEELCRKFEIQPQSVYYPNDWQ